MAQLNGVHPHGSHTIIFGEADAEPILGVTALESAGIEVDPVHLRLKKLPAVRLKGLTRRGVLEPSLFVP